MRPALLILAMLAVWQMCLAVDLGTQAPLLLEMVKPEYTREALRNRVEGRVLLAGEVGTDGHAHDLRVVHGLGFGLDANAIDAVRQWRFQPAIRNDSPIATGATFEVTFRLRETNPNSVHV